MCTLHEDLYMLHCAPSVGQGILVISVSRAHNCVPIPVIVPAV